MLQFEYQFDRSQTYILACSYGPDSMALLDMLYKAGCHFVVCFVNYHKRPESNQEQYDISRYCAQLHIPLRILDTEGMEVEGNFQEWARDIRYGFFKENYDKFHAAGVFVAHHQDDLIETYLMQKQRNASVKEYGMKEVSMIRDMIVIRPLLMYTKQDLLNYVNENRVPYSIDMSNFETQYLRNKIRKDVINHLSEIDRENILKEIKAANEERIEFFEEIGKKIHFGSELEIREIIALDPGEFAEVIYRFLEASPIHIDVSAGRVAEIRKICLSQQPNISVKLAEGVYLVKEYDVIVLGLDDEGVDYQYSYVMEKPGTLSTIQFDIDLTHDMEERRLTEADFPITIRSPLPNDVVTVGHNVCEVRRVFIDWKVPARLRLVWPVIVNCKGKIVYIPRYRKTFVDNHKSVFKIKLTGSSNIN